MEKGAEEITKLKLHHTDLAIIEDELKPEYDVLNNLVKLVTKTKSNLEKISSENRDLQSTIDTMKSEMMGKQLKNYILIDKFDTFFLTELQKQVNVPKITFAGARRESDRPMEQLIINNGESVSKKQIARLLSNLVRIS